MPTVDRGRRSGDPAILIADDELARAELGWAPALTLNDMIADAWAFAQSRSPRSPTRTLLSDGRELLYFDDEPGRRHTTRDERDLSAPVSTSEIRWDAIAREWTVVAGHRQARTFKPVTSECPLCPSREGWQTEVPEDAYDVVVFENRFASLSQSAADSVIGRDELPFRLRPGIGRCEVVVFTDDHTSSFASLTPRRVGTIIDAWVHRTAELRALLGVEYVYCFENRGDEIGVTLAHPHGQIYAYPFIPNRIARAAQTLVDHAEAGDGCLQCQLLADESRVPASGSTTSHPRAPPHGSAARISERRGSCRASRLASFGPGQPDRRAHRLQRRLRSAVRHPGRGHGSRDVARPSPSSKPSGLAALAVVPIALPRRPTSDGSAALRRMPEATTLGGTMHRGWERGAHMRIAVTGGSGKLGRTVVSVLTAAGHEVTNLDIAGQPGPGFMRVNFTDYGEAIDALFGENDPSAGTQQAAKTPFDGLVHLAAIPAPGILSDVATFHNNILSTFNVFQAARRAGIRNIVYASSETVLGLPFDVPPPYIPVDEDYPARPESVYSLVKHLEEQMAIELVRWDPTLKIIALRFSNVMDPEDYAEFPKYDADATLRRWNLWGYIDGRDGAQAVLKALELDMTGFDRFIIAAADTVMSRSNAELVAEVFPDVPVTHDLGEHDTLLSIDKARRVLGFDPEHSWR